MRETLTEEASKFMYIYYVCVKIKLNWYMCVYVLVIKAMIQPRISEPKNCEEQLFPHLKR